MNIRKLTDGGGGGGEKRSKGATARRSVVPEYGAGCYYSCWEEHRMDIDRDDKAEDEAYNQYMKDNGAKEVVYMFRDMQIADQQVCVQMSISHTQTEISSVGICT
jgi:hypothetical protein